MACRAVGFDHTDVGSFLEMIAVSAKMWPMAQPKKKSQRSRLFLAVYLGSPQANERAGWNTMDPEKRKQLEQSGIKAWGAWMEKNASVIVVSGGPLGKTKRVDRDGASDVSNAMSGYVIVEAETHEAAARLFEDHPHFSIFPGECVEIMPCLPVPNG